jgi:hypothetical protein
LLIGNGGGFSLATLTDGTSISIANAAGGITISHADTSTQASTSNAGTTVIQNVTLDAFGHMTGVGSLDLSSSFDNYSSWVLSGDSGTDQTISSAGTADFIGGNDIDTTAGATGQLTIALESTLDTVAAINFAGNGYISNLASFDGTTEITIETAIDTLANLTSIQGQTVTFSGSLSVESASVINQDLSSDAGVTFATVDTGNGAYELFAMNQDVESTDNVTFNAVAITDGTGLTIGSSVPFSDSAGTLTLQNVDAVDATTEDTIEGLIFDNDAESVTGVWTYSATVNFDGTVDVDGAADFSSSLTVSGGGLTVSSGALAVNSDSITITTGTGQDLTILANGTGVIVLNDTVGIGEADPDSKLEILDTGTQLKLSYQDGTDVSLALDSGGDLTINTTGANVDIQDALNVDSLTSDAGVSIAAGESYTGAGAVTLSSGGSGILTLDGSGAVIIAVGDALQTSISGSPGASANGMIWYDSNTNKYKIYENGAEKILCNKTDQGCGTGTGAAWSALSDPTSDLVLTHNENTTSFTWNTADTAGAEDYFTMAVTNDASTDSTTQRLLVLQNNNAGGSTNTEGLLYINNADTNEAVVTGIEIASSGGGAVTTAIDISDSDIGDALSLGQNFALFDGVRIFSDGTNNLVN